MNPPLSSYRLQFTPSFGFRDALEILPYLAELGIGAVYASPVFRAAKGSTHGYDVTDPAEINPELGGEEAFGLLAGRARELGLGWIQDIVPNHMAFSSENLLLMDVLESGPDSAYFEFFDIDWDSPREGLRGRLLAPFLGKFYGKSLEDGEIRLEYDRSGITVNYYDFRFPLKIESYASILTTRLYRLRKQLGRDHPEFLKILGALYVLQNLPAGDNTTDRRDQLHFVKQMLWELHSYVPDFAAWFKESMEAFNGRKEEPESFTLLERLLADQYFRLAFWKVATQEINYKRFFTVNNLISLRAELDRVFGHIHSLVLRLTGENVFTGLRVDHVDGLLDPEKYLDKLRKRAGDIPILVEKILGPEEALPLTWPVQGTTGYDFLNHVTGIFCNPRNERVMDRIYRKLAGVEDSYSDIEYQEKKLIIENHMAGDIDNLASLMKSVSSSSRHGYDITLFHLKQAIVEVMARFPVYRTYIGGGVERLEDGGHIRSATQAAAAENPALDYEIDFIRNFLLLNYPDSLPGEDRERWVQVVRRFEQFTVPLMAKGVEDTAFYYYNRLLALNEVGGDPRRFGIAPESFHVFLKSRSESWPGAMNATATHDTKRGEDIRARIAVLSEIPREWEARVRAWKKANYRLKRRMGRRAVPDGNEEYFLYQTLVGMFPFGEPDWEALRGRISEYLRKAAREAKAHTTWLSPDTVYEDALLSFAESLLSPPETSPFLEDFLPFQRRVAWYGMLNSLAQTLIKITAPGFPDFYQGSECWDLSLVDPDNRRPVDFPRHRAALDDITARYGDLPALIADLFASHADGRIKLFLIHRALRTRNEHPDLFSSGRYIPLDASGKRKSHLFAFARERDGDWAVTITPRMVTGLAEENRLPLGNETWEDTRLILPPASPPHWRNALSGEIVPGGKSLRLADACSQFPAALLVGVM